MKVVIDCLLTLVPFEFSAQDVGGEEGETGYMDIHPPEENECVRKLFAVPPDT